MGVAHLLLHVKSSRPQYKSPADVGTPCNDSNTEKEVEGEEWDVVITGGGSAGCVLASR